MYLYPSSGRGVTWSTSGKSNRGRKSRAHRGREADAWPAVGPDGAPELPGPPPPAPERSAPPVPAQREHVVPAGSMPEPHRPKLRFKR
jgi:hypothetical protein